MDLLATHVIEGRALWSVEKADCLEWLHALPDGCADLLMCSPPYEKARLYLEDGSDLNIARDTESWVAWLVEVCIAMRHACKGLCVLVVEGQTQNYRWSAGPALLMADLSRRGFHLRKPPIFRRVGIPGSGGPDWWRNDWEACVCFTRGGKLPWSDNTATGHAPKWAPGGATSHRLKDGQRVNQWGMRVKADGSLTAPSPSTTGNHQRKVKPSHEVLTVGETEDAGGLLFEGAEAVEVDEQKNAFGVRTDVPSGTRPAGNKNSEKENYRAGGRKLLTRERPGTHSQESTSYDPPALTFPGLRSIVNHHANATKSNSCSMLQDLRRALDSQTVSGWLRGILAGLPAETILQCLLHGETESSQGATDRVVLPGLSDSVQAVSDGGVCLQPEMPGNSASNSCGTGESAPGGGAHEPLSGTQDQAAPGVRKVRRKKKAVNSSHRRESVQQRSEQPGNPVQSLPCQASSSEGEVYSVWETAEGTRLLREAFGTIQEAWRPALKAILSSPPSYASRGLAIANPGNVVEQTYTAQEVADLIGESTDVVDCVVGGGQMGNDLASENEAPFPEALVEPFVRCFAPEGGLVADCFAGSGSTGAVALKFGRRFIGADLRQSQCDLTARRLKGEATLFDPPPEAPP